MATQPMAPPVNDVPIVMKMLNISNNTSGSSTASSVLIRATNPPPDPGPSLSSSSSDRRGSSSSFSSAGSQRVRIKAKYLREVKSPFEEEKDEGRDMGKDDYVPPALPGNLAPGYEQRRDTADAAIQRIRETQESVRKSGPGVDVDRYKSSYKEDGHDRDPKGKNEGVNVFLKPSGSLLRQGAPTSSQQLHSQPLGPGHDVRITQFAAGGKHKVFKEQLLKRQEISGPIKRYIRPTIVGSDHGFSHSDRQQPDQKIEDVSNPKTVAAVTAAAVAATVPIVKAQSDLENKMDAMLAKLAQLHQVSDRARQSQAEQQQQQQQQGQQEVTAASHLGDKAGELQRQLDDAINRRLQQLEKIQERQMEWQEKLMMAHQHPAQTREQHPPQVQLHSVANGVRSGILNQPIPERESLPGRQPSRSDEQRNHNPKSHLAFAQHAVHPQNMKPTRDHTAPRADKVKAQKPNLYAPAVTLHRYPPQTVSPAKRRKQSVSSDNDLEKGSEKQAKQPSPLDTPAPRRHAPQPLTQNPPPIMTRAGRGLLEEILTSHDEEERRKAMRGRQTHSPHITGVTRQVTSPESGAELKAAGLVQQLSKLKTEMREMKMDLIKNLHSDDRDGRVKPSQYLHSPTRRKQSELHQEAEREWDELMQRRLKPAPVDLYLRRPPKQPDATLPVSHPKQPLSPSHYNAPLQPSLCADAKAVLDQVQSSKSCLEANLEAVIRAKEQEEFYNYLDSLHHHGEAAEKAQLRYRVGRMIAALDDEIKREASKPIKTHSSVHIPEKDTSAPGQGPAASTRAARAGGKKKPVSARIDSGLRKGQQPTSAVGEKAGTVGRQNKENVAQTKKQPVSRAKKQPPIDHNQDEAYLTRVYGKALYQAKRSTIKKEPYLKYATSSPQPKPARVPSAAQVKGTEMKSAKIQTETSSRSIQVPRPVNQFFFDPYHITSSAVQHPQPGPTPVHPQPVPLTAPSHGQLIPMAVALAPPQVGGLTQPVTIKTDGLEKGVVRNLEKREVRSNVAVVNIQSEEEKRPKLTVQHLPAVDIDTELSSQASSITDHDGAQEGGAPKERRAEITPPDEEKLSGQTKFTHYLAVAEDAELEEESEDELPTPGISLPGRYTETRQSYHGPPFPPQAPPPNPSHVGPSSEQLAGDIRKDIMENAAMEWIEQELMARMISELYRQQPVGEARPASPDSSIASSASDSIVETIGPAGLQLFVDAGQAVDHTLVSALVREVLEEKVTAALGQHDRDVPHRQQAMPTPPAVPETVSTKSPIPTPEVTPIASPAHTPPRMASRVATPLASPSGASPVESETESVKELVLTQNDTTGDEPIAAPPTHVTTPVNTPPASPPPDIPTPERSPRESPRLISAGDGLVATPARTPEPSSPEPEVEESVELPPSPEPVVIEEEPVPPTPTPSLPTPTPSLPTPSTPTPTPSSDTTTQPTPSTETAGHTISEGEWLISVKSEGQVEDSTQDEPGVVAMRDISNSSSIESTLMGAEDIEKDIQEYELSEGEISPVKRTPKLRSQDPVVAILAHLRQRPDPSAGPVGYPTASQTLNNNDSKSLGEVSVGQCPALAPSSERLLFQEAYGTEPPKATPRSEITKRSQGEVGRKEEQVGVGKQAVEDSTLRISQLDGTKQEKPSREKDLDTSGQGTSITRPLPAQRIIQVVGKSLSPKPHQRDRTEDLGETLSRQESDDISEGSIAGEDEEEGEGGVNQSGERPKIPSRAPIPSNLFGTHTMSDLDTRTMTPDALNLEALLQSGYLSQTFSQSEGGTSDFEFKKPPVVSEGPPEGQKGSGAKAGGGMSFSVTLPSMAESAGMDLSQTISEGEIPAADTTSDVSEISGGPIL